MDAYEVPGPLVRVIGTVYAPGIAEVQLLQAVARRRRREGSVGAHHRFSTRLIRDSRERDLVKLRDSEPIWKERFEEEPGWHRTGNLPLGFASEALVSVTGSFG